jgi:hypothetical protein
MFGKACKPAAAPSPTVKVATRMANMKAVACGNPEAVRL